LKAKTLLLMALAVTLFLLIALVGFEILPMTAGNDDFVVLQQANLQIVRVQLLAKDVLVLAYRPDLYRTQAVNELQTVLPSFRSVQPALLNGNPSLGLPGNPSDSVQAFLSIGQSDYTAIVAAVDNILLHPGNSPDIVQVNIVLQHERAYTTAMYQVAALLQGEAEVRKMQLFIIKIALTGVIALLVVLKYLLFTKNVVREQVEQVRNQEDRIRNQEDRIRNEANRIQNTADSAKDSANRIQNTADSARNTADSIQNTADSIQNTADSIRNKVDNI